LKKAKLTPSIPMDYEKLFAEVDTYIALFKQCFYK
jgi:hypothetical protein